MAARTYVPTFKLLTHTLSIYTSKYSTLMEAHLTAPQITALAEFIICLANVIGAFGPQEIED